jgi:hypothetical protein
MNMYQHVCLSLLYSHLQERVIIHHARNVVLLLNGTQPAPPSTTPVRRSLDDTGPGPSPKPGVRTGVPHHQHHQPSAATGMSDALAQAAAVFASIIGDPATESGAAASTHLASMATLKDTDAGWRTPPALSRAWCLYELLISILVRQANERQDAEVCMSTVNHP